jgi:hypothetical protein
LSLSLPFKLSVVFVEISSRLKGEGLSQRSAENADKKGYKSKMIIAVFFSRQTRLSTYQNVKARLNLMQMLVGWTKF